MPPQLTDPGEWLKQQSSTAPSDPGEWLAAQAATPATSVPYDPAKRGARMKGTPQPPPLLQPMESGVNDAITGIQQMNEGAKERAWYNPLPSSKELGGMSKTLRGAGKAVLPYVAASNPVGTAVGMATGIPAAMAVEGGAKAIGVPEGTSEFMGDVAGGIAGGYGATKLPNMARRTAANTFDLKPDVAIEKIWRPSPADSDFPQVTPDALADVKTYGGSRVRTNADTKVAAEQAIQTLQQHLDQWLTDARTRGTRVSGNSIVKATADGIPEIMWREDPEGAQALVDQAQRAYGGKQFTTDQFRQYLKEKNAGSAGFYGKSGARQQAGLTSGTPEALEKIQGDAIREALYHALDPENGGAGPREIQTRTGRLYDLRNAADRRANAITGEKTVSGAQTFQRLAGIPGKLFHGDAEGAFNSVMNPGEGVSDPMIARLFEQTGSAPPLPRPPGVVRNLNPNRALGPGGASPIAAGPITPDASFVRASPAMNQPPNPARALPQGDIIPPSDFKEPVFGPVQGHYPNAPNPRRALPPARTFISPKYPAGEPSPPTGAAGSNELPPAMEGSFARGVNAPINPKTGQPWTVEEIKTYLAALPKYAKGGIIKTPTLLSDLKTGKPTGIMAEAGPEEIKPLPKPDLSTELDELSARTRRAVHIPSGTFPREIPSGMSVHVDSTSGDKIAFNPSLMSVHDVKRAVATKRLAPLLGKTHSPSAMSSTKHIMKQSRKIANRLTK